jgi:hypothetical protein
MSLLRSNLQYFCTILVGDYPIERYRSGSNGAQTQSLSEFKYIHGLPVLDFIIPEGHYYLADAGYPNSDLLLVPYRGVRYHLKEWATGGNK